MYEYSNIWERAIRFDQELSMINSYIPEGKHEVIAYVEKLLKTETKADVKIIDGDTDEPFIIASIKPEGAKFKLLLEGHLDVVSAEGMEKPFDGIIEDGFLYGRGVLDMKGGAAAELAAFIEATNSESLNEELYLMFSTDEEYAGEEIKKALTEGLLPMVDFAMIAEPTDLKLVTTHKGEAWADVEFFGKSAHSSIPWTGENAIYMASSFIEHLRPKIEEIQKHGRNGDIPTMNVGVVSGGSTPNVVPPYSKLKIDIRYLPGEGYEQYEAVLQDVLKECQTAWPEMKADIKIIGNWNSLSTDSDNPTLKRVEKVIEATTGNSIEYTTLKGWGEGGYINMFGIPTVYYGPGNGVYGHRPDEKIEISHISLAAKAYYNIIKELCC